MNYLNFKALSFILLGMLFFASCENEEIELESQTISYYFHNGQTVPTAAYAGYHSSDLNTTMILEEMENGSTMITVELNNTMDGEIYHMHAHDAADPATTPNGTPYMESPNGEVFAQMVTGNGGKVSVSQTTTTSFSELTSTYSGFFVVHDPLQAINTADISTYLVVGSFARAQTNPNYKKSSFSYDFNTGQIAEAFSYAGMHDNSFNSEIRVDELAEGTRITIVHNNTMDGMTYASHAHDKADPATTPNGTPYIESPNGMVFAGPIEGNGGSIGKANISSMTYDEITTSYEGFFVVHDPLQAITTVDPTTYIILGNFAR